MARADARRVRQGMACERARVCGSALGVASLGCNQPPRGFGVAVDDGNQRVDHTAKHQPVRRPVGLGRCAVTTRLYRSACLYIP